MRTIQDVLISFRCPLHLRESLEEYAVNNDLHVSQVVRTACKELVERGQSVKVVVRPAEEPVKGWLSR